MRKQHARAASGVVEDGERVTKATTAVCSLQVDWNGKLPLDEVKTIAAGADAACCGQVLVPGERGAIPAPSEVLHARRPTTVGFD